MPLLMFFAAYIRCATVGRPRHATRTSLSSFQCCRRQYTVTSQWYMPRHAFDDADAAYAAMIRYWLGLL